LFDEEEFEDRGSQNPYIDEEQTAQLPRSHVEVVHQLKIKKKNVFKYVLYMHALQNSPKT